MGRRSKRAPRCDRCRLHLELCLCGGVSPLDLGTRLLLVMHHREAAKTTATGPLALRALRNGEVLLQGERDRPLDLAGHLGPERRTLLLFPSEDATPLTRAFVAADPRPVTLIVPDGSWRQAQKASRRIPGLERAERVKLVPGAPSQYRLRREPKDGGLATFEAIARALGVIEGPEVQARLEALFERMVDSTLVTRGTPVTASQPPALEVLHRDADLVVVNKPPGVAVHRGWAVDGVPVLQRLRDQLGQRVYPVHRLDRAASGALVFALSSDMARGLQRQFEASTVEKRYLALCRGHDPGLVRVDHALAKTPGGEARPAVTEFTLLGRFERYGLFEARPSTGRVHQIRRHLKHASHPIIGDVRYGKGEHNRLFRERYGFERLALHALELSAQHPRTGERVRFRAPLPPDFAALLDALALSAAVR